MANEFKVRKGLIVQGSGSNIFDVQGSQGQLFSITDSLSGSLFSVNDISGIPIMEVFSDNTIKLGTFNNEAIIVSGSRTGMGIATPQAKLHISGASNSGLFEIDSSAVNNIIYVSGSGRVGIGTNNPTNTLQVVGGVTATSFTGSLFGTSSWATNALTASNITPSITNNTDNRVLTATGGGTINGESNLTFDGSVLTVTGRANISTFLTASTISASIGITASQYSGVPTFTYNDNNFQSVNIINTSNTSNALNGLTIYSASNASVGQFLYLNPIYANSALRDTVLFNSVGDRKLGFVANTTTAAGANSDIYFQAGSTTAGRMIYISGQAGAMGIGMGASTPTSTNRLQIRGQGATSATTALRVENSSAAARLTILDDGTSAFNTSHLYVSGSGRVGIGTATPIAQLHVTNSMLVNGTSDYFGGIDTTIPIQMFAGVANNGIGFRTDNFYLYPYGSSTRVFWGWNGNVAWNLRNNNTSSFELYNNSPVNTVMWTVSSSGNMGIGITSPTARLHVSGASNSGLFEIDSPAVNNIIYVSGSGRVGIGTSTPTSALTVSGTIESLPISTDEGGQLTLRAATGRSFRWNVDNYQDNFRIFRENDSDSSGGAVRILISGSSGNVGIHTTTPTEWIHLSSDPASSKYLRIDATQISNGPQQSAVPGTFNYVAGPGTDDAVLGLPNYWMEIKLDGNIVLIPCYVPQ